MRGREVPDAGPGPDRAGAADDARHARTPHPRLRPPRHHQPVRRARHRRPAQVIGQHPPPAPRIRSSSKFLNTIDKNMPAELDVHLVCDNYATHKTPAIKTWLAATRGSTCTSPRPAVWLNQVERWFGLADQPQTAPLGPPQRQSPGKRRRAWIDRVERGPETVRVDQNRRRDLIDSSPRYSTNENSWRRALSPIHPDAHWTPHRSFQPCGFHDHPTNPVSELVSR